MTRLNGSQDINVYYYNNKTASFCVVIHVFQVHLYEQISNINLQGFPLCDSVCPSKI